MALSDGPASLLQVEQAQRYDAQRRQAAERQAAARGSSVSGPYDFKDDEGVVWRYVTLDNAFARIERCILGAGVERISIPEQLDGLPVVELAPDSCSYLEEVRSVSIPESVASIGFCAFRGCSNLERIAFPKSLATFDSEWLRHCDALTDLVLPGQWEKITSKVFDLPTLKHLTIGPGTNDVMPGAFLKSSLERVDIDAENSTLKTDGRGIYRVDKAAGSTLLVALATPVEEYAVLDDCTGLSRKALSSFAGLRKVQLPDSLKAVDSFAFSKSGVVEFSAPPNLREIGERAFFDCVSLERVSLNEGLLSVADNAFSQTAIASLHMPASLESLGASVAAGTSLSYSGSDATFSIEQPSPNLLLDECGALYAHVGSEACRRLGVEARDDEADGLVLLKMLDPNIECYQLDPRAIGIADAAFANHATIREVGLSPRLRFVGIGAFKECRSLVSVSIPDALEQLGDDAFLGTSIAAVRIPETLVRIGSRALVTNGAHHGKEEPALASIEVAAGNPRFRMEGSLLIECLDNGSDRLVACTGQDSDLVIPRSVKSVAPYALNGLRRIRTLSLSDAITAVEVRGLAFDCLLERIHIDLENPIEGHSCIDLSIPDTARAAQQMMLAFSAQSFVNVEAIFEHYDNSIVNASGFDSATEKLLGPYEQVRLILARLEDPIFLSSVNRALADKVLQSHLNDFCVEIARHDNKELIDSLVEFGYLNEDNIEGVIEHVGRVQDAAMTNHLLEVKRRLGGNAPVDFDSFFEL